MRQTRNDLASASLRPENDDILDSRAERKRGKRFSVLAIITLAFGLSACGKKETTAAPPLTQVSVTTLASGSVPNVVELPGRIEATRTAEVRARVDGVVLRRLYEEGTDVREGTPLFTIDPRQKQAQVNQAEATWRRMEAARINAAQDVTRYGPLVARRAVSAQEYDAATSTLRQAQASVADARAVLDNARLELSYTTVRAPLSGRVGRAEVTEGALVNGANATLMTRVDVLSPIYATFTESSANIGTMRERMHNGDIRAPAFSRVRVRLVLENGKTYGATGYLNFADQAVDPATGSQVLRAQFPNPDRILLPGQFVRAKIFAGVVPDGISVPQRAVAIANEEATVMVLAKDGTVEPRTIELGALIDDKWIVRSGLKPGERLIVDGWQKVAKGQKVKAVALGSRPAASGQPAPPATNK